MPRRKILPDLEVLEAAKRLLHEHGPAALTFASVAETCGLSASTLVQRFRSKAGLVQAALLHAWDRLDANTDALAAEAPQTPAGALQILVALSRDHGGIESYAEGLLILREDLRDPVLRARGVAWQRALSGALDACFAKTPGTPPGMGLMMATHWQGSLVWWGFDPQQEVDRFVEESLRRFVGAIVVPDPLGS